MVVVALTSPGLAPVQWGRSLQRPSERVRPSNAHVHHPGSQRAILGRRRQNLRRGPRPLRAVQDTGECHSDSETDDAEEVDLEDTPPSIEHLDVEAFRQRLISDWRRSRKPRYLPFDQARKWARAMSMASKQEWEVSVTMGTHDRTSVFHLSVFEQCASSHGNSQYTSDAGLGKQDNIRLLRVDIRFVCGKTCARICPAVYTIM